MIRSSIEIPRVPGNWLEGVSEDEPAPASSLYHIACAIYELRDRLRA